MESGQRKSRCARSLVPHQAPHKVKTSRLVVNKEVLDRRNPEVIRAVAAWVEPAREEECTAMHSALQVQEQLIQKQREKQEGLRRFQGEVKRRVNQHARLRKKQQIQKSYDAIVREGVVVKQSSDAAMHLTSKRNAGVFRNTEVAICSPRSRPSVQKIHENGDVEDGEENSQILFRQHSKTLSKTIKQVRGRLAALKTVEREDMTVPGGIWTVSPIRDNPVSRRSPPAYRSEDDSEELCLAGYHDLPVELQVQNSDQIPEKKDVLRSRNHFNPLCNKLMKEAHPAGPAFSTDYRAAIVLRPGVDEEENKKQKQNRYMMYRRLFMDIEREQVKETKRQKELEKKISKIKREKLYRRQIEEQTIRDVALQEKQYSHKRESALGRSTQSHPERESEKENKERTQKAKEDARYVEALRAQMKGKTLLHNIELPTLCFCGSDVWDAYPESCANNNCVFYKNPKSKTRALQSVISSRDMCDGTVSSRFAACNITSAHARSHQ